MEQPKDCVIVIFGASGDLTKRKLIPALFTLHHKKLLPERFAVLGVSRTEYSDEEFRGHVEQSLQDFGDIEDASKGEAQSFLQAMYYTGIDTKNTEAFAKVKNRLASICDERSMPRNIIYYLSVPPAMYPVIAKNLAAHDMQNEARGWKRLIVEKPFGHDLDSALELNATLQDAFQEDQIYRIDHYLGKETVQNIMALRFANGIFEPLWNRNYIDRVEITSAESVGVEKRGGYYDHSGAMRDMVQNHLLQVTGTIAMEPPAVFDADSVRSETVKVFHSLRPITGDKVAKNVVRGQYTESTVDGNTLKAYRDEEKVDPESRTETFVALKLHIDNWRWGGVPFYLRTGKHLPTRVSEVVIHFKRTPHYIFSRDSNENVKCNQLVIRIQPDEGILLKYGMKVPGAGFQIQQVSMDFKYANIAEGSLPSAYERLLLDCMLGDATLYARSDAVEACWRFVEPILDAWKDDGDQKLYGYPAGTWGPKEAKSIFESPDLDWRYPCENLSSDGEYCEL
ncbi:MAG: glucose-6-phosphate dehydrogenase [Ectothiorhodospiraceae bacterium]|nr:glucose-6-phosphate dehydrogenase [Ectothiorhodospiraceae bacterium]